MKIFRFLMILCITTIYILSLAGCSINQNVTNDSSVASPYDNSDIQAVDDAVVDEDSSSASDDDFASDNSPNIPSVVAEKDTPSRSAENFSVYEDTDRFFTYDEISHRPILYTRFSGNVRSFVYRSVEDISIYAPTVVIGEVLDVYYTDEGIDVSYPAYTIYDFSITEVLRGDFVSGDIISISEYGGYMRGEQYYEFMGMPGSPNEDHIVEVQRHGNDPQLEVGQKCVMFLHESPYFEGTWLNTGDWFGVYYINDDNTVSRYTGEDNYWNYGSLEELKEDVANHPFDKQLYDERVQLHPNL